MTKSLEVVVDGVIFQFQARGGISRLFSEILPRMCDIDESLSIDLLTSGQLSQPLPVHSRITPRLMPQVERYMLPERFWRPIKPYVKAAVGALWIGHGDGKVWHSTYYTVPKPWRGTQVVTVVDMIHERFPELFKRTYYDRFIERKKRCVLEADAVICISETTRRDLLHFYDFAPDSLFVIPLACSDIFRRLEHGRGGQGRWPMQPFLLYVGARGNHKNFDTVIQAYSVWSHREDIGLVVVGKPWSADEKRRLAELGIASYVHLLTDVDDEELCQLYNRAAAFVFPSLFEGFGIPLLEAMACGCTIIASRIPSTLEVAGNCPIYFDPLAPESLLAAFAEVMSDTQNAGRARVGIERVKCYSWETTARQTLEVYRALPNAK